MFSFVLRYQVHSMSSIAFFPRSFICFIMSLLSKRYVGICHLPFPINGASGVVNFTLTIQWLVLMFVGEISHSFEGGSKSFEMYIRSMRPWDAFGECWWVYSRLSGKVLLQPSIRFVLHFSSPRAATALASSWWQGSQSRLSSTRLKLLSRRKYILYTTAVL